MSFGRLHDATGSWGAALAMAAAALTIAAALFLTLRDAQAEGVRAATKP